MWPSLEGCKRVRAGSLIHQTFAGDEPGGQERDTTAIQVSCKILSRGRRRGAYTGYYASTFLPSGNKNVGCAFFRVNFRKRVFAISNLLYLSIHLTSGYAIWAINRRYVVGEECYSHGWNILPAGNVRPIGFVRRSGETRWLPEG